MIKRILFGLITLVLSTVALAKGSVVVYEQQVCEECDRYNATTLPAVRGALAKAGVSLTIQMTTSPGRLHPVTPATAFFKDGKLVKLELGYISVGTFLRDLNRIK